MITYAQIESYREETFRLNNPLRNIEDAIRFVNERGFIFFWPIKNTLLASLWVAVAGNRAVPNKHDDPAHVTWRWKDSLLSEQVWYYAKILRKKATITSLELAAYFYALTENYGDIEKDYLTQYQQGKLSREAKTIYELILHHGAMDTLSLRRKTNLSSSKSESRFNNALAELQADFKILPVGIAEVGAWRYAFRYDLTARKFPTLIERAREISEEEAYEKILLTYLETVGAATLSDIHRLFLWEKVSILKTLHRLKEKMLLFEETLPQQDEIWYCVTQILDK